MKTNRCKIQDLFILSIISLFWVMVHKIVIRESEESLITTDASMNTNTSKSKCMLNVSVLKNNRLNIACGEDQFISVIKSVCHTQLGNQLSSYAALFYFKHKYGFNAFIDPVQTKHISEVMDTKSMKIQSLDFHIPKCCGKNSKLPKWESVGSDGGGRLFNQFIDNIDKVSTLFVCVC